MRFHFRFLRMTILTFSFSASTAFAANVPYKYCRLNSGTQDLNTLITIYKVAGSENKPMSSDIVSTTIQTYKEIESGKFVSDSEVYEFPTKVAINFNKGEVAP